MRDILHFSLFSLLVAGCFDEPVPAYKTVPEGARAYLQERGFADFASASEGLDPKVVDYINLDRNAVTNLDGVAGFTGLKWLRLNENRLSSLPDLSPLVSLRRIYLRDNLFAEVPEQLRDLPSLTDVDLSGNPIREVPGWLAAKAGLEFLSFSRTQLERLPDDLSAWKDLKALQLGELRMSAEEMARIRKALPNVAVVF
jgi:Leucine-rich repeat (LRR) protein